MTKSKFHLLFLISFLTLWGLASCSVAQINSNRINNLIILDYYDGSKFIGDIINSTDDNIWKIKIATEDTINVDPILTSNVISDKSALIFNKRKYHLKRGIYFFTSQSFGGGNSFSSQIDFNGATTLNDHLSLGLGIGFSNHDYIDAIGTWQFRSFVNMYIYSRYYLNQSKLRFFTDIKAGIARAANTWGEDYNGGAYFQPGIGVTLLSRKRFKWQFGISQYLLNTSGEENSIDLSGNPVFQDYNIWFNRTMFSIGFVYAIPSHPFKKR